MKTLSFSIHINASVKKVWDTMLTDKTYRLWVAPFMAGSYFVGNWAKGSAMQFVAQSEDGSVSGMASVVADNIPHELISIKHIGLVTRGVVDTTSTEAKKWVGFEKYRFTDISGQTELHIEVDTVNEFAEFMNETWPKALLVLKTLAEK